MAMMMIQICSAIPCAFGLLGVERIAVKIWAPLAVDFNGELEDQVGRIRVVALELRHGRAEPARRIFLALIRGCPPRDDEGSVARSVAGVLVQHV